MNLFQEIDQNQKNIDSEDFFNFYKSKIKEKEYELFDSINGKFEVNFFLIIKSAKFLIGTDIENQESTG